MPHYVVLVNWTEQGVRNAKETVQRTEQARQMVEELGGRMDTTFWTLGAYDVVSILEAPDDETATAAMLRLGGLGNVRTQTLRAFTAEEASEILEKLG